MEKTLFIVSLIMMLASAYLYFSKENLLEDKNTLLYQNLTTEIASMHRANEKLSAMVNILISDKGEDIGKIEERVGKLEKAPTVIQVLTPTIPVQLQKGNVNRARDKKNDANRTSLQNAHEPSNSVPAQ